MEYDILGYELGKKLGEGQYGVVFKAIHKELNQERAIKILKESDKKTFVRYKREMKALSRINHPHIVQFYEHGILENKLPYFVMEYIEGKTLEQELKECSYNPEEAVERILPLMNALQAIHDEGVIHRDIKPSNILIDKRGRPYLTDFGLAKGEKDEGVTQTGQMLGTPKYMSPEQTLGEQDQIDHQTDIYSLGAVFYELLTGTVPHDGDNMFELLHKINEEKIIPPSELNKRIPEDINYVCLKMLENKKGIRYQYAGDIEEDLYLFLDGEALDKGYSMTQILREILRDYKEVAIGMMCGVGILLSGSIYLQYKNQELDGILKRQEKYKNKLEDEVRLLEKGKEKNKQMIKVMEYIDILENEGIPKDLSKSDGSKKLEEESYLVKKELQQYVQGLLTKNKGYQANSYREYRDLMVKAAAYFLKAFELSDNNLWYLTLGYECDYLNLHVHEARGVRSGDFSKYFFKNKKLLFPEKNKELVSLFVFDDTDLYMSGLKYGDLIKGEPKEQIEKYKKKLLQQVEENQSYMAGYFNLGALLYYTSRESSNYDEYMRLLKHAYERYQSPMFANAIMYGYYRQGVENMATPYEKQCDQMLHVSLKKNPYLTANLYIALQFKRTQYLAYQDKNILKDAMEIGKELEQICKVYTEIYKDGLIVKEGYNMTSNIDNFRIFGWQGDVFSRLVQLSYFSKDYESELKYINLSRHINDHTNILNESGNLEYSWIDSTKNINLYSIRRAQLLEYFGKKEEAIQEYKYVIKLYDLIIKKESKKKIYIDVMKKRINKKIYELEKK